VVALTSAPQEVAVREDLREEELLSADCVSRDLRQTTRSTIERERRGGGE
jgi:hypothetical protein